MYFNDLNAIFSDSFDVKILQELAISSGFIQRNGGKITADGFLKALMFSVNNQAQTSLPDIVENLKDYFEIDVSKVGLHKRFSASAVCYLKEVLKMQLTQKVKMLDCSDIKSCFPAIKIKDSTKFSLPSTFGGDYPGFGNFSKVNGLMNIQFEYNLI